MLCALCRDHDGVVQFAVDHDYILWVCQLCLNEYFDVMEQHYVVFGEDDE